MVTDKAYRVHYNNFITVFVNAMAGICLNYGLKPWAPGRLNHFFRYIKIQPKTIELGTRLWGINREFVGFVPQGLELKSIVSG